MTPAPPAERPRLSVVIPCHNDGDYLTEAVASVTLRAPEAELIIVDDGSTQPRTREVLAALREAGHRVIEQPHAGLPAARNTGIAASAGDYFLPLDADNRLLPGFAAEAVALLDADPAAGVIYGDRHEFGTRNGDVTVPELDLPLLLSGNYIDACAVVRREVWSEVGGYDVTLDAWEDWDFWLGAAARGWRFVRIPHPTFEYRVRPDSLHHRFLRRTDYLPLLRRIYEKYPELVSKHAVETIMAGHVERRQLRDDAVALRDARDVLQVEIDRLAGGTQEILAARDAEQPLTDAAVVFTIVARNYLAYARVLAASLARHNPHTRLRVVLLDDPDRSIHAEPSFEIIHADELPFDPPSELYTMAAIYDVTELATAVKPWAFQHLFARGAPVVLYLDPDIEVFDSLGPLESLALAHGMVLTPHVTEPLPQDGKRPEDRDFLLSGMYNLGFLALSAAGASTFLPWWRGRLRRDCLNDTTRGLFVDQRWIDFAPAIFAPAILKDPGYNVAYWNLPHRVLTFDGDRIAVNGRPLRFFHYSGFSPRTPHLLSKHQHAAPRVRLSEVPILGDLCRRYAAALGKAGFAECDALHYGFATTATQLPLDARARRVLRRTYVEDEARDGTVSFPNPFSRAGAADVLQRLLRPSPHAPEVPAYLGEIWSERADLRVAFHHIASTDAEPFLDWVRTRGIREHQIHPQLIPPPALRPDLPSVRTGELTPGVNVYGYVYSESGTGQIVRAVVAALAAEGIPYAVVPFTRTISRQDREFGDFGAAEPSFDTNLICVNADPLPLFFEDMRGQLPMEARNIGLWAWEVEDLPAVMGQSESYLDEVWGISSFTAEALSRSLTKPVRAFPLPVVVPEVRPRTRAELGMPEGFLFLFSFDYDSVFRRKNPLAVVAAFRQAFADRPEVVLYIKTTNAERHGFEDEELRAAAVGRSNIVIRDGYVSSDDYFSMLDACDCYVSLHRSEGFGLTVAEAMALGKPVISTAYSSTLEFANETNSFLVPAQLTEVGENAPPYPPRSHWAEPDVVAAAQQMVRVYTDPDAAAAVGARARADIQALHSPSARGPLLRRLLDAHRRPLEVVDTIDPEEPQEETPAPAPVEVAVALPESIETEPIETEPIETEPIEVDTFEVEALSAESLLGSPRADLPSAMQRLVMPLRRLVLRCIRVYWVQQLAIHRALLTAMRTLRRESRAESASQAALLLQQREAQEQTAAETDRMREELIALADDLRALRERIAAMSDDEQAVRLERDR